MTLKKYLSIGISFFLLGIFLLSYPLSGEELDRNIRQLMEEGDIPGLSLVIVRDGAPPLIKGYGYADLEAGQPVTPDTLFEIASCSKAFTALAVLRLEKEGLIKLDDPVSQYLPWFYATYDGVKYDITLRHLLHQTSGIPWKSIDLIPRSDRPDALEQTVRRLSGIELDHPPGTRFVYATINYDVLGLVIEKVSGLSYSDYMQKNVFLPLGLTDTAAGVSRVQAGAPLAQGYKIGFSKARRYDAPVYRGNTPAGYIVANGKDMARWLQLHMGTVETDLYPLLQKSRQRDETVAPSPANFSSYAMGWYTYVNGSDIIDHPGLNPNFTSYLAIGSRDKIGVGVLANSDSAYTSAIGRYVLEYVRSGEAQIPHVSGNKLDKVGSMISLFLAFYLLLTFLFLLSIAWDVMRGRRAFRRVGLPTVARLLGALIVLLPFLFGIYLIPQAMSDVSWNTATVWSPVSFQVAILLLLAAIGMSYVGLTFSSLFPQKNKYLKSMPFIVILSVLAGGANAVVIFLITSSLFSNIKLVYQLYYFAMAFFVYVFGRKVLQTKLLRISFDIVYDLRMRLINKVFLTSYQKFENMDRGRVYATLNDDTGQIGNSANLMVQLITMIVTAAGAFVYLATIAFWATMVTLGVVIAIAVLYGIVSKRARGYLEKARDTMNVYMGYLNGMLDGFKELSLQVNKKREYRDDIERSCDEFRSAITTAMIRFINAFLIGESLLIIVLGAVGFAIPRLFPDISVFTLMSFIMVLLYLIGPINAILNAIPAIMRIKVSWNRVKGFERDIPANMDSAILETPQQKSRSVESIKAEGLEYEYETQNEEERFKVGPLDFEAKSGEITFIIGGNGSGKTTLAKLLTGLYAPDAGDVKVEGAEAGNGRLGEHFSTVFSNYHLFNKLYNVDTKDKENLIQKHLNVLQLQDKVSVEEGAFTTVNLSGGQRKRLALMQCYLEDSPIYLFDEVAADQDPEFRKFFYRDLLLRMKEEGKIVIAITHDDHYFDVADKIIKMDMGKIEKVDADYRTTG